jgi:hypothetical protein
VPHTRHAHPTPGLCRRREHGVVIGEEQRVSNQNAVEVSSPTEGGSGSGYVRIDWFGRDRTAPMAALAGDDEPDEEQATQWWGAAHELRRVEEWVPFEAVLEGEVGWPDLVQVPDLELLVHSTRFRDAIETGRQDGDTHAWLPVRVVRADEAREYAVLNVWGAAAGGPGGVDVALAGGRTVVLPAPGDGDPAFASRVRTAADAAGIALAWDVVP